MQLLSVDYLTITNLDGLQHNNHINILKMNLYYVWDLYFDYFFNHTFYNILYYYLSVINLYALQI